MSTWEKTSLLIEQQFPDFVRDEGPKLVAFLKAYYEWMERDGEVTERSQNLLNYRDVDNTLDQFIQYFQSEVADQIPRTIAANKRELLKHIRDLYRAKGTERAYELLFRLLYDEDISFYYPGIDMLRASDGRWVEETSIRLSAPSLGVISDLGGEIVRGITSGATAKVDRVETVSELGVIVDELYISSVTGTFQDGERVRNTGNTINGTVFSATGPATGISSITVGGSGHAIGDVVNITGLGSGVGANGTISSTDDASAITFSLKGLGAGYRLSKLAISISGGTGIGGGFTVDGISNTESITFATTKVLQVANTRIDGRQTGDAISPTIGLAFGAKQSNANPGVFIEANLAVSNCFSTLGGSLQFATETVGSISGITTTDVGVGYTSMPVITIRDEEIAELDLADPNGGFKGQNALVTAANLPGAIKTVNVNQQGSGYDKFSAADILNISDGFSGTNARGFPTVTGIVTKPGFYDGTRGFLSWNNKLQDNLFYQEYSYVVRSKQFVNAYKEVAKAVVHPAGTKLFGFYDITPEIDTTSPTSWANNDVFAATNLKIESESAIISVPEVVSVSEQQYVNDAVVFATEINYHPYFANTPVVTVPFTAVPKIIVQNAYTVQPTVEAFIPEQIDIAPSALSFAETSGVVSTVVPTAEVAGYKFSYQTTVVPDTSDIQVLATNVRIESSNVMARFYPQYITDSVETQNVYQSANTPTGQELIEYLLSANTMHSADYYTPKVRFLTTPATTGRGLGEVEARFTLFQPFRYGPFLRGVSVDIQPVDYLGATTVPTAESELRLKYQPTAANTIPLSITTSGTIWHRLAGNVDITTTTTIDDYDHLNISAYEITTINSLGTNQALTGEVTTWNWTGNQPRKVANGDIIKIADPFKYHVNSYVANSQHTVERVFSNNLITITTGYLGTPLTNGAVYLANTMTIVNTP